MNVVRNDNVLKIPEFSKISEVCALSLSPNEVEWTKYVETYFKDDIV